MHRVYGAQMDVTTEDWVDTCEWMAEENAEEWPGLEIPIDKEDCDVMYILTPANPSTILKTWRRPPSSSMWPGKSDRSFRGLGKHVPVPVCR